MSLDPADLSDGELVALSLAGRDQAFAEIVRRYREGVYRLAYAGLGNADDALDVVQDVFVAAHRNLARFDGTRTLKPWLAAIALNRCRDLARRRRVRRALAFVLPFDETTEEVAQDVPGSDAAASDRQELSRTMEAISELPVSIREPLILHTVEGLSQAETATLLGISEKAVETRLRRARQRLREMLGHDR